MTSSQYSTISLSLEETAAVIRLNRPAKRNAINLDMMTELEDALTQLDRNRDIAGIIITGEPEFFSSGVDLNVASAISGVVEFDDFMTRWRRLNRQIEEHSKPVIAAIEGFCMTGGLELALACDLRIAGEGAAFAITSARIGTVAGAGGTQRLPRIVGIAYALEVLFAAEPIDATRAERIGLINRLCPKGMALEESRKLTALYSSRGPIALRFAKRAVYGGMQMPLTEAIEFESFIVNTIYTTADKKEGIQAFLEKRTPHFKGN
jgi:enoyl-CoA hydratase/carnithine racemase